MAKQQPRANGVGNGWMANVEERAAVFQQLETSPELLRVRHRSVSRVFLAAKSYSLSSLPVPMSSSVCCSVAGLSSLSRPISCSGSH